MSDAPDTPQSGPSPDPDEAGHDKPGHDRKMFKRRDLISAVGERTGLPRPKASAAVEAVFGVISDSLKAGHEVYLVGFGFFAVSERKSGKGRDPRTGQEIDIPRSKSVRFRPGKTLRASVADPVAPEA